MREKKYANHCPIISPPGALVNGPDASTGSFAYGRLTPPTPNTHRHPRNRTGTRFLFPLSKMKIWPDWYSVMMDPFRLASRVDEMQSSRQTIAVLGNFSCFSFTFTEFPWVHVKLMKFEKKLSPRRFFLARFKWKPQKIRLPDSDVPLWEIKIPKRGETLRWIGGDNEDQATTKNRTGLPSFTEFRPSGFHALFHRRGAPLYRVILLPSFFLCSLVCGRPRGETWNASHYRPVADVTRPLPSFSYRVSFYGFAFNARRRRPRRRPLSHRRYRVLPSFSSEPTKLFTHSTGSNLPLLTLPNLT